MKENLNVEYFRNGDLIPETKENYEWEKAGNNEQPSWCYYDNNSANGKIYGKLYNWYAVKDSRGLAPDGWHIPSDEEWTVLKDYLGGEDVAGGKMKFTGTQYWQSPNKAATNGSDFSGLSGGYRSVNGEFNDIGDSGSWWCSTELNTYLAWSSCLGYEDGSVSRNDYSKKKGFSVRCIRD